MDLDTNVKKFKYSIWAKILCIVLSFITFVTASGLTMAAVFTGVYNAKSSGDKEWTQTDMFENMLYDDVNNLVACSYESVVNADISKEFDARKEAVVEEAYKQYLVEKEKIQKERTAEYYGGIDVDYETTGTTVLHAKESINVEVFGDSDEDEKFKLFLEDYPFTIYTEELYQDAQVKGIDEKELIAEQYDTFAENSVGSSRYIDKNAFANSLRFQVGYDKNAPDSNINDFSTDNIFSKNIYFTVIDGELKYAGIPDETANYIYKYVFNNEYAKKVNLYLYFEDYPGRTNMLTNIRYWNDKYFALQDFSYLAKSVDSKMTSVIIADIIMAVISFAAAFYFFLITGKKSEDDEVKLRFVDKVPYIIHLGIWVAIGFGIWVLGFNLMYYIISDFSVITGIAFVVFLAVCWGMLFEFCASVSRYCRSDKRFYNSLILYHFGKLLKKGAKKTAKLLCYKPEKFKQNIIIMILLYAIANLVGLLCIIGMFYLNVFLAIALVVADLAVNIYFVVKVVQYVTNLDKIICSASHHEEITLNMKELPQSLRTLAESLKYTNDELNAAVAKAVRDERLKTELITNVSHDLKTPLTSIITYVDLLSKCEIEDEKAKEYIAVLDDKGAKLKRLIEDLIEASKVTTGNVKLNATSINLQELCLQAVGESQQDFEKVNLELLVKETEDAPIVFADGAKAFRIMENLLTNARKYSAAHTRVYVSVYNEQDMGVFEIKNISAQALDISPDELTQRFVRGDKSRNQEGNGLGLSIAKELCRIQNGRLELSIDGDLFKAKVYLPLSGK